MGEHLTIGQVAELTGVPRKTIRYYEEVGILPAPERTESRYRSYSETDVRRLELVRRAKLLDMPLSELRKLVEWASNDSCDDFQEKFRETVRRKMEDVDQRVKDLQRLKEDLTHLEAHLAVSQEPRGHVDHAMLACSPETCTCLGAADPAKTP